MSAPTIHPWEKAMMDKVAEANRGGSRLFISIPRMMGQTALRQRMREMQNLPPGTTLEDIDNTAGDGQEGRCNFCGCASWLDSKGNEIDPDGHYCEECYANHKQLRETRLVQAQADIAKLKDELAKANAQIAQQKEILVRL